jgi:hypothetical protein
MSEAARTLDASSVLELGVSYVNGLSNHQRCWTDYKDWNVVGVESQQFPAVCTSTPVGVTLTTSPSSMQNQKG